tara:strand:+ start:6259 stop:6597 length:339 start_codon:yes stop_codon:yes gene_type:complete
MANINKSNQLHNYSVQENLSPSFMVEYEISNAVVSNGGAFTTSTYGTPRGVVVGAEIGGSGNLTITFADDSTVTLANAEAKAVFLKGVILPLAIKSWAFSGSETAFALMAMY